MDNYPQMSLFDRRVEPRQQDGWYTGDFVREGAARFVHLIRARNDPDRTSRELRKSHGVNANRRWRELCRNAGVEEWRAAIVARLRDGQPRTFNRLCLEIGDITADIAFEKGPDVALWQLVEEGILEHTGRAPVHFRLVEGE